MQANRHTLILVCFIISSTFFFMRCQTTRSTSNSAKSHLPQQVGIADARIVLRHLVHGTVPKYQSKSSGQVHPGTETLSLPEYCFSKCKHNNSEKHDIYQCFQTNTQAFLLPFSQSVKDLSLTEKTYLNDIQTVEKWVYDDHWAVIVNFGSDDFLYQTTLLPQYGFIALGPNFLAQHYYPHADEDRTELFIQHNEEKFIAFE